MKLKCAVYLSKYQWAYDSSSFALGDINQYFHFMLTKIMTIAKSLDCMNIFFLPKFAPEVLIINKPTPVQIMDRRQKDYKRYSEKMVYFLASKMCSM